MKENRNKDGRNCKHAFLKMDTRWCDTLLEWHPCGSSTWCCRVKEGVYHLNCPIDCDCYKPLTKTEKRERLKELAQ